MATKLSGKAFSSKQKLKSIFSRENLEDLLGILKIPFVEWNGSLTLGKTESGLLSNDELLKR